MSDDKKKPAPGATTETPGKAGAALASAMADLLGRAFEIAARKAGTPSNEGVGPAPAQAGWIDALFSTYRGYLGQLASILPAVAQRISQERQGAEGNRLLVAATPPAGVAKSLDNMRNSLATTDSTIAAIKQKAGREELRERDLPALLREAHAVIDADGIGDLPALLDRLKYDFRMHGKAALKQARDELKWLTDSDKNAGLYKVLDALSHALGEKTVRKLLRKHWLDQLADAVGKKGEHRIPAGLEAWLREELRNAGIELSGQITGLGNQREVLVLDHAVDAVFEIRRPSILPAKGASSKARKDVTANGQFRVYGAREGRNYEVEGRKLLLPARVLDASQGMVVWSVDKLVVQESLDNRQAYGPMKAWDIGQSNTPLALFMVDYKEGDLGPYLELGLGCFAAPRTDPLAVGMYALGSVLVTTKFSQEAGRRIWGYDKRLANIEIEYRHRQVKCTLGNGGSAPTLTIEMPRGGGSASVGIPLFSYTIKGSSWHRTVITRSGTGEMMRSGGSQVTLSMTGLRSGGRKEDVTREFWDSLLWFGIVNSHGHVERMPMFTTWTEHMSAELGAPAVVAARDNSAPA
ncbi:MAG TPA: hypothetical protein VF460_12635 [Burkholderiales bacterium]